MSRISALVVVRIFFVLAMLFHTAAAAADELDILKGKTIRFIVGGDAASGTDRYGRPFAEELKRLLPDTTIRVQALPGAGSMLALRDAYQATGTVITLVAAQYSPIYAQLLKRETVAFDLDKFHWIGAPTNNQRTLAVRASLGDTAFPGLFSRQKPIVALIDDFGSPGNYEMRLISAMTGVEFRLVTGMEDDRRLAILVAGDGDMVLNSYYQLDTSVRARELVPILRFGKDGYPAALAAVPTVGEIVRPGTPPELVRLLESFDRIGRPIAAAPATPPEIVVALRLAFDRIVAGNELAAVYARQNLILAPTSGADLTTRIHDILGRTETAELLKRYLACSMRRGEEFGSFCP